MSKKRKGKGKGKGKAQLVITVESLSGGRVRVEMLTADADFYDVVNATQYLMWVCARDSNMEFDAALEKLCEGARSFYGPVYLVPNLGEGSGDEVPG